MKMPGKELALVVVGLAVLVAVWVFAFMSTQRRSRPESADVRPAAETGAEPAAHEAVEPPQ